MKKALQKAIQFFVEHADDTSAIDLALAEQIAKERGWNVEWRQEDDIDLSWCEECAKDVDHNQKHADETYAALLWDNNSTQEIIASLGNIDRPDRNYRRVIEAELALAAIDEQRGTDTLEEALHGGRRAIRIRRVTSPHGMCETYCVEHESNPEVESCR